MTKSKRKKRQRRKRVRAKSSSRASSPSAAPKLLDRLARVDRLIRQGQWDRAGEQLNELDHFYPRRREVLSRLVQVCYHRQDMPAYQAACERLLPLVPDDPDLPLMLAGVYMANGRPALALRTFRRFLERWPEDPRADEARKTAAGLKGDLDGFLDGMGLTGEDHFETATLHEEVQCRLEQGEFTAAREVAQQVLQRHPDFLPALNNTGEAYFREGHLDQAVTTARQVLGRNPENYHALSNLARYLCLSGRLDEAQQWAERLKAVESEDADLWVKKAEALACLGDDQGVLDAFGAAKPTRDRHERPQNALLYHLAAVATMRLDREKEARKYWNRAIKIDPALDLARENLEDLKQPIGRRHAPWAFSVSHWVSEDVIRCMQAHLAPTARGTNDRAVTRQTRKFLQQHPHVAALVPMLLDRGDPNGREFAVRLAMLAETPELLSALRDFALGQRGPDELRLGAAQFLVQADVLPSGPINLWREGKCSEILLFAFELHDEVSRPHSPQVESWAAEAMEATQDGDPDHAERLLRQALEVEPDAPDLLNNLCAVYERQGRHEEVEALIRRIHRRHPDYLFGRVNMAHLCVGNGQFDKARALLEPLLCRKRLHLSEFAALCAAHINLLFSEGDVAGARSWLKMWEDAAPDHPDLARWRQRLLRRRLRQLWGSRSR